MTDIPFGIIAEPVIVALHNLEASLAYARSADNEYINAQPLIGVCEHHAPIIERVRICERAVAALRDIIEGDESARR